MTTKTIELLDVVTEVILLIWAGMALCVTLFATPLILKYTNSYGLAELMMSKMATRLDVAAWLVFGAAFFLVKSTRFVMGVSEFETISYYMRLWSAAALLALLVCFTSTFIVAPKLCAFRSHVGIVMDVDNVTSSDNVSLHKKAFKISHQMILLRLLLAIGMAVGVKKLPRQN
jgi:hypothetical protein